MEKNKIAERREVREVEKDKNADRREGLFLASAGCRLVDAHDSLRESLADGALMRALRARLPPCQVVASLRSGAAKSSFAVTLPQSTPT